MVRLSACRPPTGHSRVHRRRGRHSVNEAKKGLPCILVKRPAQLRHCCLSRRAVRPRALLCGFTKLSLCQIRKIR
jgi:hypothetical protein